MAKPPRRCSVIYSGNIDKASCLFEEVIKTLRRDFVLEGKETAIFNEQAEFASAIQTRIYRIYDLGKPTPHCIKFVYDTRDKEKSLFGVKYNVSCNVESRPYIDAVVPQVFSHIKGAKPVEV